MILSQFPAWGYKIIQHPGYLGLFFINLLSSSSILFPLPGYIFVFIFGKILNPWLVALFSSLGATFGECTSYGIGIGGEYILKKQHKYFQKGKEWFEKGRGFLIILIFAVTPLPFDVVGILSGILNYDFKKFLLATFLGKMIKYLALALAGFYGIGWILKFFKFSL